VDAGQHDLRVASGNQLAHLGDDLVGAHRSAAAAGVGDDAVAAEGVAAVLDLDEGAAALGEGGERQDGGLFSAADVGDLGRRRRFPFFEKVEQVALLLVAKHQGNTGDCEQGLRVDLGVAAGHHHPAAVVEAARPADEVARLGVGGGGHRAGVDDDQVGSRLEGDHPVSGCLQALLHGRRLELVGLAAQCCDGNGT
jgi:hypothetical protein